jgi:hypothetical protein
MQKFMSHLPIAIVLIAPAAGFAAVTGFTDRASFESAVSGPISFESFEGLPLDPGTAERDEVIVGDFTLSAVNEGFTFIPPLAVQGMTSTGGAFATDGVQHINVGSLYNVGQNNDIALTFAFDTPITAFFADFTDLGGIDQAATPRAFYEVAGETVSIYTTDERGGALRTVGFTTETPVSSFSMRATAGDSFGVDAVSYVFIPEPATAGLLALASTALLRRRRV